MRIHRIVMALAMLTIFSLAITSCGYSDEPSSESIIGTWKGSGIFGDSSYGANLDDDRVNGYYRFNEDGTGLEVSVKTRYKDPWTGEKIKPIVTVDVTKFTYTIDGDKLSRTQNGEVITNKYKLSGSWLILELVIKVTDTTEFEIPLTLSRVKASELDQYLK